MNPLESCLQMCTERIALRRGELLLVFERTLLGQAVIYWEIDSGFGFGMMSVDSEIFEGVWEFLKAQRVKDDPVIAGILIGFVAVVLPAFKSVLEQMGPERGKAPLLEDPSSCHKSI